MTASLTLATPLVLSTNCRNTRRIAAHVSCLSHTDPAEVLGADGPDVDIQYYEDSGDFLGLLRKTVNESLTEMLEAEGMDPQAINQIMGLSGAFDTLTDEDGKAVVINHEEQYVPTDPVEASIPRFEDPLGVLEAAASQAFAENDIDKPTLDALMELLAGRQAVTE